MSNSEMHMVIGASGLVGSCLLQSLEEARQKTPILTCGTSNTRRKPGLLSLDIADQKATETVIDAVRPSFIYLPAAYTHVDGCETNPTESYWINVRGVKNVVDAAKKYDSTIVYFSSDYVFDGKEGPYNTNSICNPVNEYGRQKLAAENYLLFNSSCVIVRTCGVFGSNDDANFAARLYKNLRAGKEATIPEDQFGTPTYAPHLAHAVVKMTTTNIELAPLVHVVNNGSFMSRYNFAAQIAKTMACAAAPSEYEQLIRAVSTGQLQQKAARPMKAGLISSLTLSHINSAVSAFVKEMDERYSQEV